MDSIYIMGERTKEDVTGFAADPPPLPDTDSQAVDQFMAHLRPILPSAYEAMVARHRRIVHGEQTMMRSESWLAQALYNLSVSASHARLRNNCDLGYAALERWWSSRESEAA
jgi:hypothetical protein